MTASARVGRTPISLRDQLVSDLTRNPEQEMTCEGAAERYATTYSSAYDTLNRMVTARLLKSRTSGRKFLFSAGPELLKIIGRPL